MEKYLNGRTATTAERTVHKGLELPQIILCPKHQYNYETLDSMGLPQSFFVPLNNTRFDGPFPDLNETYRNVSYSFKLDYSIFTSVMGI